MRLHEIDNLKPGSKVTTLQAKGDGGTADPEKMQNLFKRMESKCSQIIDVYLQYFKQHRGFKFFLRGSMRVPATLAYYGRSHDQRRPKDTTFDDHYLLYKTMEKAGIEAHRGNSVFMRTGSVGSYGTSFIMFPVDGFKYTWSPTVVDLYSTLLRIPTIRDSLTQAKDDPQALREFYTDQLGYKTDEGLLEALSTSRDPEVMVSGYFYALNERYLEEDVNKWLAGLA